MLTLPWLVTALHVGVFVDRLNRRSLMVGAETARLLAVGAVLLAIPFDLASLPLVYVVALVLGIAEVVAMTAGASIIPSAAPKTRWQQASARITGLEYLFNGFVGAPVGGFLVAAGIAFALGLTGAVYAIGAVLLALLVGQFAPTGGGPRRTMHVEIREGLTFLWQNRLLRTMALLIAVMAGTWAAWYALLPTFAVSPGPLGLDARGYGLLMTCMGAGGVIGAALVGPVNRMLGRRWAMFVDVLGTFLLVAIPALVHEPWAIGAGAFAAGMGGTMWTVNSRVLFQTLVPDQLLGRFSAAYRLVSWGSAPVATALAGVLAQWVGFGVAFGTFAVLAGLCVVPYLRVVTKEAVAVVDQG